MKTGGKNSKQNDALRMQVQGQLEEKKKECLEISITLQSLQSHNAALVLEKQRVNNELSIVRDEDDNLIKNLKFHISILQDRNREILIQKRQLQIKHDTLRINHDSMCSQFQAYKISREIEFQDLKKRQLEDRKQYQISQNNFHHALTEHSKLVKEIAELKQIRQQEKEIFKNKLADIQRDKIQSIDIIKKQMTNKACQMRNKALQIRKQQFQTTTRLTFLQNDQLIRELEFQSSKTQNILKRNIQLEKEVKDLKRCIQIHEGVEKEIMKRNVVAKNMISSLSHQVKARNNQKSKELHREVINDFVKIKSVGDCQQKKQKIDRSTKKSIAIQLAPNQQNLEDQQEVYEKMQFLQQINKNLQKLNQDQANQIKQLQNEQQNLKKQLKNLKNKIGVSNCDNIASLIIRFYQQCVKSAQQKQIISEKQEYEEDEFNLQHLKGIQIEKWSTTCVEKIVKIILNSLRPYLTPKILNLRIFKPAQNDKIPKLDYENLKQNICASKYIQAMKRQQNKSLENIKQRSISYILDEAQKHKHSSSHRRLSSTKVSKLGGSLEPVAKRFMKPYLQNKV